MPRFQTPRNSKNYFNTRAFCFLTPVFTHQFARRAKKQKRVIVEDEKTGKSVPSPYVFTTTGRTPISGWSKIKKQIVENLTAQKIKLKDWRYHDFRRTVSTGLGDLGYSDQQIGIVLNHGGRGVTAIYNRSDYVAKKKEMMEAWEQKLLSCVQ